jgi:hypothetical protein
MEKEAFALNARNSFGARSLYHQSLARFRPLDSAGSRPGYGPLATATMSGDVLDSQFGSEAVETPRRLLSRSTASVVTVLFAAALRAKPGKRHF